MDIPNSKNSERSRLLRENSAGAYLSQSAVAGHFYGTTPTSLRIPNVNSITDLQEIERAFNSYTYDEDDQLVPTTASLASRRSVQLSQSLKRHFSKPSNSNEYSNQRKGSAIFRMDSEASTSSNTQQLTNSNVHQLSNSTKTTRMSNFVSSNSIRMNSQSYNEDTNSLYHYMREQSKKSRAQKFESLDYEINENVLYLMDKKRSLRSKQNGNKFCKYVKSFFPSQKEFSRWFIIFLIGTFTALTACFIVVNVEYFSELKYKNLRKLFNLYLNKNTASNSNETTGKNDQSNNSTIFGTYSALNGSFDTINFNKENIVERFVQLQIPLMFWFLTNAIPVFAGSALVTYLAPVAAGSGIPVIKCYLNGVKVPEVVRVKTYIAKMFGVIAIVVGGLCSGKEGPLIHCGSIIAAGISQGKSTTLKQDLKVFRYFREDHEKRDFVSAGAAAGVAGAFGAPVGGVLFSLEEGASFWSQLLTWRIFFCSLISTFTLNFIYSAIRGKIGQMSFPGLINFGRFDNTNWFIFEIPIFIFLGCAGGLIGALFNSINHKLTIFRMKYINRPFLKVLEAVFISLITALIGFLLIISSNECKPFDNLKNRNMIKYPLQFNCKDNEFSTMASFFLNNAESVVINMFHLDAQIYSIGTLLVYLLVYFLLSVITYGLSVSSGIFIPALLIGSVFGRLVALCTANLIPGIIDSADGLNELSSKFALIGAASVLGGIVRMTLSLTVILIETTGNLTLGLPLMVSLIFAKWIGDLCNEGLYDIHIKLQSIPFLACEPHLNNHEIDEDEIIFIKQIMSCPVITLNKVVKVRDIVTILKNESHYGFPVVDCCCNCEDKDNCAREHRYEPTNLANDVVQEQQEIDQISADYTNNLNQLKQTEELVNEFDYISRLRMNRAIGHYGKLRGFILRWQLIVLLQKKIFDEYIEDSKVKVNTDIFRDAYPRYDDIDKVVNLLTAQEMEKKIDLGFYMNPSPYSVRANISFDRGFRLFRALGLRHLCVTDDSNNVVGIVTRKDISHFKVITHRNRRYIQKYSETLN